MHGVRHIMKLQGKKTPLHDPADLTLLSELAGPYVHKQRVLSDADKSLEASCIERRRRAVEYSLEKRPPISLLPLVCLPMVYNKRITSNTTHSVAGKMLLKIAH